MSRSQLSKSECLQVQALSPYARVPCRGSSDSAGLDVSSARHVIIPAGGRAVVLTDLIVYCPKGTYCRIAPRR